MDFLNIAIPVMGLLLVFTVGFVLGARETIRRVLEEDEIVEQVMEQWRQADAKG